MSCFTNLPSLLKLWARRLLRSRRTEIGHLGGTGAILVIPRPGAEADALFQVRCSYDRGHTDYHIHNQRIAFLAAAARLRSLSDSRFGPGGVGSVASVRLLMLVTFGVAVAARRDSGPEPLDV